MKESVPPEYPTETVDEVWNVLTNETVLPICVKKHKNYKTKEFSHRIRWIYKWVKDDIKEVNLF